jgi:succinate-semialdehyde dehydrogenase/glutarate-semialdehyde dehydrogenase
MSVAEKETAASFVIINPATGKEVVTYEGHTDKEVDAILTDVGTAQRKWRALSFAERSTHFRAIAAQLRKEANEIARTMALEMGKPIAQGLAEVEKCAGNCDYYAEHAASFLADEKLTLEQARIQYQPLGTVLAVMPWNFPYWQVIRCVGPIMMAGNAMVLKHASNVMGCAVLLEEVVERAGLPRNVFRTLKISARQVPNVIRHPTISAVTLTGSEPAGRAVTAAAGAELKPCVLELGGSDPFVVLDDANIDEAAKVGAWARNQNAGQSCIAAKRFIVVDSVYDKFVSKFAEHIKALRVGDPLQKETEVGPMARADLRDELHDQVVRSVESGAKILLGGSVPNQPGAYYPPTVLTDVKPGMAAFDEETFGPVAAVIRVKNEAEAIAAANNSRFGLGASLWTTNMDRANRVASQIESGMVFVNSMTRSDSRLPFGGIKASGFGRELWVQGIRAFANVKTVCVGWTYSRERSYPIE